MTLLKLPTRETFPAFPYATPYAIQLELMRHLHSSIEDGKITVVESPTGTGKTLSLLCASLQWLADDRERARKGKLSEPELPGEELDWVIEQTQDRKRRELEAEDAEYEEKLSAARNREARMKKSSIARVHKRTKLDDQLEDRDEDDTFLPEDNSPGIEEDNISPEVHSLIAKFSKPLRRGPPIEEPDPTCLKIYYASRTHSQLAQVLAELKKMKFTQTTIRFVNHHVQEGALSIRKHQYNAEARDESERHKIWRTVSLGSRKQLCINDRIRSRGGDLDEKCRELLGEKAERRCSYLPQVDEKGFAQMNDFRDQILAVPKDIEDLAQAGRMAHTCPYFGSRKAVPQAELVVLPYNLLLSKTARETLGIELQDQVVIIDEAHNLISTLLEIHSHRLSLSTLSSALGQVKIYIDKFKHRLKATHAIHLKRLFNVLSALEQGLVAWRSPAESDAPKDRTEVVSISELMNRLGKRAEGINLLEIEGYLRSSKIARKISGYSDKMAERAAGKDIIELAKLRRGTTPPLHAVEAFLLSLTTNNDDGRIVFGSVGGQVGIKYQLLNPMNPFRDIVHSARSVVLAGGTMSPISDVINQLFPGVGPARIATFSCGHIIPKENLRAVVMAKGPKGGDLVFNFNSRQDEDAISELGQILYNLTCVIPSGMVVFLPSYGFFHAARASWEKSGLMARLSSKKKVFSEPQESNQVEVVLREYSTACRVMSRQQENSKISGALLFAVIGAKLSEGLNFTDELARAVIIVGMPYANRNSPELRERMEYVRKMQSNQKQVGKDAASELYENICMNAVNQSIGRAIRHRDDWAGLILLDRRYSAAHIRHKLPKWIDAETIVADTFGQALKTLGEFYRTKRM